MAITHIVATLSSSSTIPRSRAFSTSVPSSFGSCTLPFPENVIVAVGILIHGRKGMRLAIVIDQNDSAGLEEFHSVSRSFAGQTQPK